MLNIYYYGACLRCTMAREPVEDDIIEDFYSLRLYPNLRRRVPSETETAVWLFGTETRIA